MKKARSLLYEKLYGESDAAIIFFNFNHLATGIWDLKIIKNYEFIVFNLTAQKTQSEPKKLQPLKL